MNDQEKAVRSLEARARLLTSHINDIDFIVAHKDLLRAVMLVQALNGDDTALGAVKDALKHGENALLVWALSTGEDLLSSPGLYVAILSTYAFCELSQLTLPIDAPPYEDMWALSVLIAEHYEPVPYAPYTRGQLVQAMKDEQ